MRVKINSTGEIKEVKQVGDKLFDKENNCYLLGQVTVLEEWHPASELPTIPKNYICVEVLFRTKYGVNHLGKFFGDKWISYDDYTYKTEDISYWMEVQPPRKEDKK